LHRFGFGPRFGATIPEAADAEAMLLAEIERPDAARVSGPGLLASDAALRADYEERERLKAERREFAARHKKAMAAEKAMASASAANDMSSASPAEKGKQGVKARFHVTRDVRRTIFADECAAHVSAALTANVGLAERLVWFWSNHFCVSTKSGGFKAVVGAYEREAIRPYVFGKFADMVQAVGRHPAMLMYLDNVRSFGPNSRIGLAHGRGLNENLARETLELHTLGVRTVYTQADVTNFSKVLTGWGIVPLRSDEHGGQFEFSEARHEPGPQTVIGKVYPDTGVEQGRAVLADLAHHPATAHHIATKLVIHFIADEPPQALVKRLAARFLDTGGDLKEVTKTLVTSEEAWNTPRTKLKRPAEWAVAALRSVGAGSEKVGMVTEAQNMLSEPLWHAPSPKGYSDQSSEWIGGIAERLDIATFIARRVQLPAHPTEVLDRTLGPLASADTRKTVSRAADGTQALALLLMAPEFQMR
jgi:uncharacterized protein (DUF1800 family)